MRKKTVWKKLLPVLFVLLVLGYLFVFRPVIKINKEVRALITSAKELKSTFSKNNIDLLNSKMSNFSLEYETFEKSAKSIYWASFIPYVSDFRMGVEAGSYVIKAAGETITAITPYADLIGFKKGQVSFVEKSAEDRLQTAVMTLDKVLGKIDVISNDIKEAEDRINKIDPSRYPKKIGKTLIRENIINVKEQFKGASSLFVDAKPLIKRLPEILGGNKEKTYLTIFQNDKERRATGGFFTFYAIFKVNKGKLSIYRSEDIYSLDQTISPHPKAPREILTYHKGVSQFYLRDSNLSPDLVESIKLFESLYQKSGAKVAYDGIILVDSKILVDMLTIFGDTESSGIRFSAKIDKRCDCPQVIYTLFDIVDRPVGYLKENRKGVLGDLMYALFYKALGFSPSKYWGTLATTMYKNLQEKHILLNFTDQEIQKSVEKLGFAGRIDSYEGDYLHVNSVNFAGAKSNLFVSESTKSIAKKGNGGLINKEVTVEYKNPYPASDCNLERGGLCLNAILRNWVRFYVPKGSKLIEFKGSTKKVQTYDELGKTVFEGFLEVPTEGKATVVVTYTLPQDLSKKDYSILVQKQGGTDNQKLRIEHEGKILFDGLLNVDKVIKSL